MQKVSYYSELSGPVVEWVFKFFSTAIGCKFYPTSDQHTASIIYAHKPIDTGQLHIPFWPAYYERSTPHCLRADGYWVPIEMQHTAEPHIDYVGLVFRLLTLTDELMIPADARDQLGNLAHHAHFERLDFHDRAMVDEAIQELKGKLVEQGILRNDALLPRWPNGKRYAVLITHDTDGPCLLEPKELIKAGIKGLIRLNSPEWQAFLEGCRRITGGGEDPYFNFARWAKFEQSLGASSAFYIYVKSKGIPGHVHNPLYCVENAVTKWNILHQLSDYGWEIGLHASLHALEKDWYLQTEKRDLEDFLGKPVKGNRCHYWHINWLDPNESFHRLANSGFTYDCSLAWKDRPGFRSGTTIPYHPYDSQCGEVLKLLEIPTNVMDGHLFEYQTGMNPYAQLASLVDHVKTYGGVLNIDWHTRTWVDKFSYAGWRSFIVTELAKLTENGEAWFTTPQQLSEHCCI